MSKYIYIALSGKARSGKDTAANIIQARFRNNGVDTKIVHFADKLKRLSNRMIQLFCGETVNPELLAKDLPCGELYGLSLRQIYQEFGQAAKEELGHDIWLRSLPLTQNSIVADVRFPEELAYLESLGAVSINIVRKDAPSVRAHVSESHQLQTQFTIHNDGTLEEYELKLHDICDEILKNKKLI